MDEEMSDPIVTWHFSTGKLGYGDGREIKRGVIHSVEGNIKLCEFGLHGSVRAPDALRYAPGCIVSRCEHRGSIIYGDDKLVSEVREYVAVADATDTIVRFTRWCADRANAAAYAANAAAAYAYAANAAAAYAAYAAYAANAAAAYAAYAAYAAAAYAAYAYEAEREAQNEWLTRELCELIQKDG